MTLQCTWYKWLKIQQMANVTQSYWKQFNKTQLTYILSLCANACILWSNLIQQMNIDDGVLNVGGKVGHLPLTRWPWQVWVDPADQDLFWTQLHQRVQRFTCQQQHSKVWMIVKVDVWQQPNLQQGNGALKSPSSTPLAWWESFSPGTRHWQQRWWTIQTYFFILWSKLFK